MFTKKTFALIVPPLVGLVALVFFVLLPWLEKEQTARVSAALALLPGEMRIQSARMDFFGSGLVLKGLNGVSRYADGSDVAFAVDALHITGLAADAFARDGVIPLAEEISLSGLTLAARISVQGFHQPLKQVLRIEDATLTGIRGDLALLRASAADGAKKSDIVRAVASVSVAALEAEGYSSLMETPRGQVSAEAESFSVSQMRLFGIGRGAWRDLRVRALESDILTLETLGVTELSLPDFYTPILEAEETDDNGEPGRMLEYLRRALEKNPFLCRNMELRRLNFHPLTGEALSAERLFFDMQASASRLTLRNQIEGLVIPAAVYRMFGLDSAYFAAAYEKALEVDALTELELRQDDGTGELMFRRVLLAEKNLGGASFEGELYFESESLESLLRDGADLLLHHLVASVRDKDFLEYYFTGEVAAMRAFNPTAELSVPELRLHAANLLRREARNVGDDYAAVLEGLAKLMLAPGSLRVALNPERPLYLEDVSEESLNVEVEYIPAQ